MKRLLSIMLLAAATTLTAQADKEIKHPDSYNYSRGVEAYDNDNISEAIDYLNREVAVNKKMATPTRIWQISTASKKNPARPSMPPTWP